MFLCFGALPCASHALKLVRGPSINPRHTWLGNIYQKETFPAKPMRTIRTLSERPECCTVLLASSRTSLDRHTWAELAVLRASTTLKGRRLTQNPKSDLRSVGSAHSSARSPPPSAQAVPARSVLGLLQPFTVCACALACFEGVWTFQKSTLQAMPPLCSRCTF